MLNLNQHPFAILSPAGETIAQHSNIDLAAVTAAIEKGSVLHTDGRVWDTPRCLSIFTSLAPDVFSLTGMVEMHAKYWHLRPILEVLITQTKANMTTKSLEVAAA